MVGKVVHAVFSSTNLADAGVWTDSANCQIHLVHYERGHTSFHDEYDPREVSQEADYYVGQPEGKDLSDDYH